MKIRNGFVSNSSSSSFILLIDEEHFNDVLRGIHPYMKYVVKSLAVRKDILRCPAVEFIGHETEDHHWLAEEDFSGYTGDKGEWKGMSLDVPAQELADAIHELVQLDDLRVLDILVKHGISWSEK